MAKRREAGKTDKGNDLVTGETMRNAALAESKGVADDGSLIMGTAEIPGKKIGQASTRDEDTVGRAEVLRAPEPAGPMDDAKLDALARGEGAEDYVVAENDEPIYPRGKPGFDEKPVVVKASAPPRAKAVKTAPVAAGFQPFLPGQDMFVPELSDLGFYTLRMREVKNTLGDWQKYSLVQNETMYSCRTGIKFDPEHFKKGYSVKTPDALLQKNECITVDKVSCIRGELVVYIYCHGLGFDMKQGDTVAELYINA